LATEPSQPGALFVKAKVDLADERIDDAVTSLRAAIDIRPDWAQAHFVLGTALAIQGEGTMARSELARALELDAGLLEARKALAKVHARLREPDYAVEEGHRFLRERPDDVETRVLVAQSLVMLRKPEEALEELEALPEEKRDAAVLFALGRVHTLLRNNEEARALFLRADEETPGRPEILQSLMLLDLEMGRATESDQRIAAALEASPDDAKLHRLQGVLYLRQNQGPDAEKSFRRAIALDPKDVRSYEHLARYYTRTGRLQETILTFEKALEAVPDEARLHHFLGVLYESGGQHERAIERYEAAIQHDPNLAEAKNNLAYLFADSGENLDRALDLAQEAKATMPDDPNAADTLGWVLFKRGIPSAAISYLKEAEGGLEPANPSIDVVRYHLALAYEANGDSESARGATNRALEGLEQRMATATSERPEPPWASDARAMLDRLPEPSEEAPDAPEQDAPSADPAG
jgi:tetratricopeptide (TPR) repeat protein